MFTRRAECSTEAFPTVQYTSCRAIVSGASVWQPTGQVPALPASKGYQGPAVDIPVVICKGCRSSTRPPAQPQWKQFVLATIATGPPKPVPSSTSQHGSSSTSRAHASCYLQRMQGFHQATRVRGGGGDHSDDSPVDVLSDGSPRPEAVRWSMRAVDLPEPGQMILRFRSRGRPRFQQAPVVTIRQQLQQNTPRGNKPLGHPRQTPV